LARRGLSVKNLQNLKPWLLPMEKPQERILSGFSMIAKYGVKWIHDMIGRGKPARFGEPGRSSGPNQFGELSRAGEPFRSDDLSQFKHQLIVLEEIHE
jgi:hypothetical protein